MIFRSLSDKFSVQVKHLRILIMSLCGYSFGRYAGAIVLAPILLSFLCAFLLRKTLASERCPMMPALAIQGGHFLWFLLALLVTGQLGGNWADVILIGAGIVWLHQRASLSAIVYLGMVQTFALAINVNAFFSVSSAGNSIRRALLVHATFRTLGIIYMLTGYFKIQTRQTPVTAVTGSDFLDAA